jgi:hypothetical protein
MRGVMRRIAACLAVWIVSIHVSAGAQPFSLRNVPGAESALAPKGIEAPRLPEDSRWLAAAGDGAQTPKSKSKAVLYSLLLPGMGHYYVGSRGGARTFLAIEAATWTTFIVFEVQGHLRESGYQDYATVFAGVSRDGHSDDYYAIIAEYDSWEDYEAAVKTDGQIELYPGGGAAALEQYFVENRVSDFEPWVWKSADERRDYRTLRSASKRSYRRALYAVGVAVVNRVASAFFAIRATNTANERLEQSRVGYHLEFGAPVVHPGDGFQTGLTFVATF